MNYFESIAEAFKGGGWGMWPILFIFIASAIIAIERAIYLLKSSLDARSFIQQLAGFVHTGNFSGAVQFCLDNNKPLTRIVAAGFAQAKAGEERVLTAMDEVAYNEIPRIEKRTGYLALLGNIATLTGLLGTILGLIKSFKGVSREAAADKATLLAAGISEAMNCTAFGLLTGITALLAYSVLNGKTQALIDEINHMSLKAFRLWRVGNPASDSQTMEAKPITSPAPHLMHNVGLKKGKAAHGHKKSTFASLQLTPMIDMFIVVLIFLLMNFSGDVILFVSRDVKLPFAEKVDKLDKAPVIAISFPENDPAGGVVTLDGSQVSTARELKEDDGSDWKISKLSEQLEVKKHNWKLTHPNDPFPGEVIVQSDQNVDFKIIKKIMYSCGVAGYANVHFAVTPKVGGKGEG